MKELIYYLNSLEHEYNIDFSSTTRGTWIFRGENKAHESLIPSIGRTDINVEQEKLIYKKFRKALPSFGRKASNNWELLVLAQHYCVPTRLLDWTFNPLTALFFACENENSQQENGFVYALRIKSERTLDKMRDINDYNPIPGELAVNRSNNRKAKVANKIPWSLCKYTPGDIVPRIVGQEGLFLWYEDPKKCLFDQKPVGWKCIPIPVPSKEKKRLKEQLFKLGFTYSRIFADLDGVGNTLTWEINCNKQPAIKAKRHEYNRRTNFTGTTK